MGKRTGGVASALLTGIRGKILQEDLDNIRYSGLAHLIAISGLHLAIIVGLLFFLSRYFLAHSQKLALKYDIKKWAAVIAIIGGFAYLTITGMPVSAKRAYIMISLILLAIILDRRPSPMRSVAMAAIIIMFIAPPIVTDPSFHMSFSAVVMLIAVYNMSKQYHFNFYGRNIFTKTMFYVWGIIISTIAAEIAIDPLSIYHFNNYSLYGMIANLIAIPLTTFWIMPLGVLSFPLMPVGLEKLALIPMSWGITIILDSAKWVVSIPNSVNVIGEYPWYALGIMTIGGLWLCLWDRRWRFLGIPFAMIGVVIAITYPKPDLLVNGRADFFAVTNSEGYLYFSKEPRSGFTQDVWMKRMGEEEFKLVDELITADPQEFPISCGWMYCYAKINGQNIYVVKNKAALEIACNKADIMINFAKYKTPYQATCDKPKLQIHRDDLWKERTHLLYIGKDGKAKVRTMVGDRGKRRW